MERSFEKSLDGHSRYRAFPRVLSGNGRKRAIMRLAAVVRRQRNILQCSKGRVADRTDLPWPMTGAGTSAVPSFISSAAAAILSLHWLTPPSPGGMRVGILAWH